MYEIIPLRQVGYVKVKSESRSVVSDSLRPHGLYNPWNYPGQNTGVGSLSLLQGIFPTQGSNLGLPHCRWILYQLNHKRNPRILEWVAYPFSRGSSWPRNWTSVLHCRQILYQLSYQGSLIDPLLSIKCCQCCYRVQTHAGKIGLVICFCRGQGLRRFQGRTPWRVWKGKRYDTAR